MELTGHVVKPDLEDADFRLHRCYQCLVQSGLKLVAASLGFYSTRLCGDCPCLHRNRTISAVLELGANGVPCLPHLGLEGGPGVANLVRRV
jgi:hypothetical protein